MNKKKKWNEFWATESDFHEVFVCGGDDNNNALKKLWHSVFAQFSSQARIIDMASGAGSIYRSIEAKSFSNLVAVDGSTAALSALSKGLPDVTTIEQDITIYNPEVERADHVVSQFGIEYGGIAAFKVALAMLSSGGSVHCLCHGQNSSIPLQQRQQLEGIELIRTTEFLSLAMHCIAAMYRNDVPMIEKYVEQFRKVEPLLARFASEYPQTFAAHIHASLKKMILQLKSYNEKDVLEWCESAMAQCDELESRARDIVNIALDTDKIQQLEQLFALKKMENFQVEDVINENNASVIGLLISARKP
ncbi:hypothetical protein C6Y40_10110 [Alteromonas alba]|uniref:Methyltransferase domain-containing protein n=1 Tax=Alteromonas alba TaxID=2079529 RepID=A0A2S9VBA4_9ALTE|nr:class I SAM-dependent methyltransferase [Alteromonas alba]PRO73749.1 hypothetical protein C6Y40_10110 [Alteromonas alba]